MVAIARSRVAKRCIPTLRGQRGARYVRGGTDTRRKWLELARPARWARAAVSGRLAIGQPRQILKITPVYGICRSSASAGFRYLVSTPLCPASRTAP
jgi:hypothetical protein